ncbi:GNAT family N-acetyltransferase [Desulfobotulus sp. H1]|uniref:GNAT family N-acetyltransferase n=1 Tax=Desulfobotulus pelophilus TaxID=2823377 RepID=A0ABT3NC59_9BACT|nr:GNAT family N-acetyltransferase [Desulfobotulus pelophilus]MCW7755060.1 GNAT family N-acetyltransferase [Desulfobotulus pelophilus]
MVFFLKRAFISIKDEGLLNFLKNIINFILFQMGMRPSHTFFFVYDFQDKDLIPTEQNNLLCLNFSLSIVNTVDACNDYEIPDKLKQLPLREWFEKKSILFFVLRNNKIAAYAWVHFDFYDNLGPAGTLYLDSQEVFIGPFFTVTEHRKKGLYDLLMKQILCFLRVQGIQKAYGSSNIENMATVRVLLVKNKFKLIGLVTAGSQKKNIIDFAASDKPFSEKVI